MGNESSCTIAIRITSVKKYNNVSIINTVQLCIDTRFTIFVLVTIRIFVNFMKLSTRLCIFVHLDQAAAGQCIYGPLSENSLFS